MNRPLLKLKADGVITGQVFTFGMIANAIDALRHFEGRAIVRVMEEPKAGTYWVMSTEDAARMRERGYEEVKAPPRPAHQPLYFDYAH